MSRAAQNHRRKLRADSRKRDANTLATLAVESDARFAREPATPAVLKLRGIGIVVAPADVRVTRPRHVKRNDPMGAAPILAHDSTPGWLELQRDVRTLETRQARAEEREPRKRPAPRAAARVPETARVELKGMDWGGDA